MKSEEESSERRRLLDDAVTRFQRGIDRDRSFQLVVETYYLQVQRFFSQRGATPADRADLTQETFLKVYRGLQTFRGESQLHTWIYRIAANTWHRWLTEKGRRPVLLGFAAPNEAPGEAGGIPEPAAEDDQLLDLLAKEQATGLRRAVDALPERMRRCLEYHLYHHLKYKEIALLLGISEETVKVHIFQAKRRLRERLADVGIEV